MDKGMSVLILIKESKQELKATRWYEFKKRKRIKCRIRKLSNFLIEYC